LNGVPSEGGSVNTNLEYSSPLPGVASGSTSVKIYELPLFCRMPLTITKISLSEVMNTGDPFSFKINSVFSPSNPRLKDCTVNVYGIIF
jgi:hypothetical protein